MQQKINVSGMTCSACSAHVEKSVSKLPGMEKVSVNLLTNSMQVEYDEKVCDVSVIVDAVEKAGYGASPIIKESQASGNVNIDGTKKRLDKSTTDETKRAGQSMKERLAVSIVFLVLLMYLAMHHMLQMWFGLPVPGFMISLFHGSANALVFAFAQFLLVLPILYVNRAFFETGFKTLFRLHPNMDSLIAIGAAASVLYGIFAIFRIGYGLGHGDLALVEQYMGDLYFESAGTILTLITVGKYLESRSKGKTKEAITALMDLSPKTAAIIGADGEEREIPVEQVLVGDLFLLRPGSAVPVDGVVVKGNSSIDEAVITGESMPVEKTTGDKVTSATMNKAGTLTCRATRVGEDTTLAQIIRLVEEASASKAPIAKMADTIAGVFVPIVIVIALLTMGGWLIAGAGFEFAMSTAIAVLVISCPCALGLATPVAIMVGTGVGAGQGILIKSGEALQAAGKVDTVVLDKTGTITAGKPVVTDIVMFDQSISKEQMMQLAAALEQASEHPLAEAVVMKAGEMAIPATRAAIPVTGFEAVFGRGVKGYLEQDGKQTRYLAGNVRFLEESSIAITDEQKNRITGLSVQGKTPLLFADDKQLIAVIAVADAIKESSGAAIRELQNMGIEVVMLTGDNQTTANAVKEKLGIGKVIAQVLPEDKEKEIRNLQAAGRKVAMVGDGINDAPALMAADVGIAIGAGTDVALESADIVLMKSMLTDVVTSIRLSRKVIINIKENLFWAFFYNSIGIPLAAGLLYPLWGIKLSPMYGAAAMSLSSLFVVGNALRLKNFKRKKEKVTEEKKVTKTITIEGMSCGHCTGRVQKALEGVAGVKEVTMSLEDKSAVVILDNDISDEILDNVITEAGYEVTRIKTEDL